MRILFVENHALFAETVVDEFLDGHRVVVVSSISDALNAFRSSHFDVGLIDYDLDDAKGDVFIKTLRGTGSQLPLVATSARDDGNDALLAAGANTVCQKGDFRNIVSVLYQVVRGAWPKPIDEDIRAFRGTAPSSVPAAYIEYLRTHGAAQLDVAGVGSGFVGFWELVDVLDRNLAYGFPEFAPGLLGFASDGAGQLYAFDLRDPNRVTVGDVSAIPLEVARFRVIAESFQLFAKMLSDGALPCEDHR